MNKADLIEMSKMPPRDKEETLFVEGLKELLSTHVILRLGVDTCDSCRFRSPHGFFCNKIGDDVGMDTSKFCCIEHETKTSCAVYEYQYTLVHNVLGEIDRTEFLTKEEFNKEESKLKPYFVRDDNTKRIRIC